MLYHSRCHGLSYNRFQHHCFKYPGPTIFLLRAGDGTVVGTCLDQEWKVGRARAGAWGAGHTVALLDVPPPPHPAAPLHPVAARGWRWQRRAPRARALTSLALWRPQESTKAYGGASCRTFVARPGFKVVPGQAKVTLNLRSRSADKGIAMGTNVPSAKPM